MRLVVALIVVAVVLAALPVAPVGAQSGARCCLPRDYECLLATGGVFCPGPECCNTGDAECFADWSPIVSCFPWPGEGARDVWRRGVDPVVRVVAMASPPLQTCCEIHDALCQMMNPGLPLCAATPTPLPWPDGYCCVNPWPDCPFNGPPLCPGPDPVLTGSGSDLIEDSVGLSVASGIAQIIAAAAAVGLAVLVLQRMKSSVR